jgi:hypothetical protein
VDGFDSNNAERESNGQRAILTGPTAPTASPSINDRLPKAENTLLARRIISSGAHGRNEAGNSVAGLSVGLLIDPCDKSFSFATG